MTHATETELEARMTDQELHSAYERQLRRSLHPPWELGLDPGGTRAMLNASQVLGTADIGEADDGDPIWLWSDLHLGDHMAPGSFGRPFDSVPEMDEGLLEAWHRTVGADDTIIVAGDVMLGSPRERPERTQRIIEAPGYKVLVYGNHDQNGQGGVVTDGFDEAYFALRFAGDPVLVVTHVPLADVPSGIVNVHGHTHQHQAVDANRHINVSVEQLEYRPRRLTEIRRLARELLRERPVRGETTAEQLARAQAKERP